MNRLEHKSVYLRAVEPSDATRLFQWENNPVNWKVSHTEVPFSMQNINLLIEQFSNLRTSGQLRLIICKRESDEEIGTIDLFDVNFKHGFATLGVLIADEKNHRSGYATEALELLIRYCTDHLELRNLQCFVHADNEASIKLFRKLEFIEIGVRLDWYSYKGQFTNEIAFQKCLKKEI